MLAFSHVTTTMWHILSWNSFGGSNCPIWQLLLCVLIRALSQTIIYLLDLSGVSQKLVQHVIQTNRGIIK